MTLSGTNTYTGGTTISAGTLQIGNGGTAGSVLGNITNNAALIFNRSDAVAFGNVIGGSGTLEKLAGTLTLSGINTYTGATTVNGGTLEISGSIASGTSPTTQFVYIGTATAGNAAITNGASATTDFSLSTGPNNDNKLSAGSINGGGNFRLGQNELTVGGNDLSTNVTGIIADGGLGGGTGASLIKAGYGTLNLSGINTYTGATTVNSGTLEIQGSIASSTVTSNGTLAYMGPATAGSASITNNGFLQFYNTSTAGSATISNNGFALQFLDTSTAGNAAITNNAILQFESTSTAGSATITNGGTLGFYDTSTAGSAAITNNNDLNFYSQSTAGNATITNNGVLNFNNTSTAGSAAITNGALGNTDFSFSTGPLGTRKLSAGSLDGGGTFNLGANELTVGGNNLSTNVTGIIADGGGGGGTGASLVKTGSGTMILSGANTYTGGTTVNGGTLEISGSIASGTVTNNAHLAYIGTATAGNAAITNGASATTDFSLSTGPNGDNKLSAGSIDGGGSFTLGQNELTVGGNNLSTTVSGIIADGGDGGGTGAALIKTGAGTLTLSGINTYTGATTVDAGTLRVDGSITASSGVTVNSGGTLAGVGTVGNTIVNSGGTLLAGNGPPARR